MTPYWKDMLREIGKSFGRYLSLIVITALGSAAVVGILSTSLDMRAIADKTYKARNLYDIQIKSTTGFTGEDADALRGVPGVEVVMPASLIDSYAYFEGETLTMRAISLPDTLNSIELVVGRLPESADECAVEAAVLRRHGLAIGDSIRIGLDDMENFYNLLALDEYVITGVVVSPFYIIPYSRGNTSLGDGRLNYYMYLHPDSYALEAGTDLYVRMEDSARIDNLTQEYYDMADGWVESLRETGEARIAVADALLTDARAEVEDGWAEYRDGLAELRANVAEARAELDDARAALDDGLARLEEGEAMLAESQIASGPYFDDARRTLDEGWAQYNGALDKWLEGVGALDGEEADALGALEESRIKLEDAQKKLDGAPAPEWFYFTRSDSAALDSFFQDTNRLESIGYVFPVVFFIVAILVSLTTMSRMVDEQRTQIGIYKALGYGTMQIVSRLLVYAFGAGVTGGLLGAVFGCNFFPRVIYGAYLHLYDMPPIETPIPAALTATAISVSVGVVIAVTFFTSVRSMRHTPAELMRPKAPISGKRVLLEKIPFFWKRLSFTAKVNARNILRYKKRFIMTLAGVAGCAALLVTSFGLRDSLGAISELQYGKLTSYDARAYIKEITSPAQRDELDARLDGKWLYIREESITAEGTAFSVSMIVPESSEAVGEHISLRSRATGETIPLSRDGVLLTEKLAREIGIGAGDSFRFTANDGASYDVPVAGVVENYVMHHAYASPELYASLTGSDPLYNGILISSGENVAGDLLASDSVRAVVYTSDMERDVSDSTDALEIVAIVLILLASTLAFVVLFNLTNINIIERVRELATIKVLGFYNEELSMYIYRENAVVTLAGIALGVIAGIFLHGYVLRAAEIDLLMFPRIIKPLSYVYSVAISMAFALFVNLVMNFKLAGIDMVRSLKDVE